MLSLRSHSVFFMQSLTGLDPLTFLGGKVEGNQMGLELGSWTLPCSRAQWPAGRLTSGSHLSIHLLLIYLASEGG